LLLHISASGSSAVEAPEVTPALREGETVSDGIMRIRGEVAGLQTQLARVKNAPLPKAEIEAWVDQQIALWRRDAPRIIVTEPIRRDNTGVSRANNPVSPPRLPALAQ
jgi:hypothetical protein